MNETGQGSKVGRQALIGGVLMGTLAATGWSQTQLSAPDADRNDWFGFDVAAEGDLAVVGSWRDSDAGGNTGSAHVVSLTGAGGATYVQKLVLQDPKAGDLTGMRVETGDGLIALSAPGRLMTREDGSQINGTVVIFEEIDGNWQQVAELDHPSRSAGDLFGQGVSIQDGYILIGAPRDDEFAADGGAVYVFVQNGGTWTFSQKLAPSDIGPHDFFGHDIGGDSDRAMVGAYNDDDQGVNAGAVYALSRTDTTWSIDQKLVSSEGSHFDFFGTSVALDQDVAVVGAPQGENSDPNALLNEGAAIVFQWNPMQGNWQETYTLRPGDPTKEHRFGIDVAVRGDTVVVGSSQADHGLINSGAVHVFQAHRQDWFEMERRTSTAPQALNYFGLSVAIGDSIVVGAPGVNAREGNVPGIGAIETFPIVVDRWLTSFCQVTEFDELLIAIGGALNSAGQQGRLLAAGSSSRSRDDLTLRAVGLPPGAVGMLIMGSRHRRTDVEDGASCIGTGGGNVVFLAQGADDRGRIIERNVFSRMSAINEGVFAGQRIFTQLAYRDPVTGNFNFTSGVRLEHAQ